jgi:phosphoribosylglycinamide formyltransferase-1
MPETKLATFFSGGGRTILNLLDRIEAGTLPARLVLAIADRECSGIDRLRARGLDVVVEPWVKGTTPADYALRVWPRVQSAGADLVCLCGFLRMLLIPDDWEGKVMNIHPGLLPDFGGQGMWGDHVHRAVLESGVEESGCTVHFADNVYDHGPILVQRRVPVLEGDTADSLAARVFEAECEAYPEAITLFAEGRIRFGNGEVSIQ